MRSKKEKKRNVFSVKENIMKKEDRHVHFSFPTPFNQASLTPSLPSKSPPRYPFIPRFKGILMIPLPIPYPIQSPATAYIPLPIFTHPTRI